MRLPKKCRTASSLEVVRTLEGEQLLAWVLAYEIGSPKFGGSGRVLVDAHDGSVVDSRKSW